jgi:hypothetical protein
MDKDRVCQKELKRRSGTMGGGTMAENRNQKVRTSGALPWIVMGIIAATLLVAGIVLVAVLLGPQIAMVVSENF